MSQDNLLERLKNKYSQVGQDGLIEHIFQVMKIDQGHFVEFGAWDGVYLSNCRKLYEQGWSGVFIEADAEKFKTLQNNYRNASKIKCVHARVEIRSPGTLDEILSRHSPDRLINFLSIDIDGLDFEVFESIEKFLPQVVCLEGGKGPHPLDPRMPAYMIDCLGQSLSVIAAAARKKGYRILCAFQDVFLIQEKYFHLFNVSQDLKELYLAGYHAQTYSDIPMYASRLRWFMRRNRILDYVMEETGFHPGDDPEVWATNNRETIRRLLDHLPDSVWNARTTCFEKLRSMIFVMVETRVPRAWSQALYRIYRSLVDRFKR